MARPDIGDMERENVIHCMRSGWISQGVFVAEAEAKLRTITGRKHAVCTSSGTMALIVALLAAKHRMDRKTIPCPAMTFAAVHNAIRLTGSRPLYIEHGSDWQTSYWGLVPHPVVLMAACYGGGVYAHIHETTVINDCAESFGGTVVGRRAESLGDISCLSFFSNKICVSGEGGALLTDSDYFAAQFRLIINHGIDRKNYMPEPETDGLNGRMTDMQAAILCAQLDRMDEMVAKRRRILNHYRSVASDSGGWSLQLECEGSRLAPWLFAGVHSDIEAVRRRADAANIEWRPFFPVPKHAGEMKTARDISENGILLPLSSTLTDEEVDRVSDVIRGK